MKTYYNGPRQRMMYGGSATMMPKKKMQNGGILNDLRKKEFYQSRGTKVRLQKAAGRRRWLKKMSQEQLPQKRF